MHRVAAPRRPKGRSECPQLVNAQFAGSSTVHGITLSDGPTSSPTYLASTGLRQREREIGLSTCAPGYRLRCLAGPAPSYTGEQEYSPSSTRFVARFLGRYFAVSGLWDCAKTILTWEERVRLDPRKGSIWNGAGIDMEWRSECKAE